MERKVTLVLGSGVAWGLSYAGVIKALEELCIRVTAVGGTSMGAMIGGIYAAGTDSERMLKIIGDVDTMQMARVFLPTLPHGGIVRTEGVRKFIRDIVGSPKIEDMPIPFYCPATDVETGEEIVFAEDSLLEAVVSSVAIPILFQPNHYRGRYLVDGGLVDPLPLEFGRRYPDPLLGFTVIPEVIKKQQESPGGIIAFLEKLAPHERGDFLSRMLKETKKRAGAPGLSEVMSGMILISNREVIRSMDQSLLENYLVQLDLSAFGLFDFLKGEEIAEEGYKQTLGQKDRIFEIIDRTAG